MIQITPQQRLLIHVQPIDFRKGIDGLVGLCRKQLDPNPFSGTLFVFRNNKATSVKLLTYDGTGFWLMQKRFSKGCLRFWPKNPEENICATNLMVILNQGTPAEMQSSWRPLPSSA